MKTLVFSDLHAKFDNIVSVIEDGKFDHILFAGDIFGYFIGSKEILKKLLSYKINFILGNHDLYYLRRLNPEKFNQQFGVYNEKMLSDNEYLVKYGAIDETLDRLKDYEPDFLYEAGLISTMNIDGYKICMCHGSPYNPFDEYVYPDSVELINRIFSEFEFDILICGHTHKQFIYEREGRFILNPGSCTIPRGELQPSYIVIEVNPISISLEELPQVIRFKRESRNKVIELHD